MDAGAPLASVFMITYNHAPFIRQAIESILSQETDFAFELVIGDDCCTDGTSEIVQEYAKAHPGVVRQITSATNVGMTKNAVRTLMACRGKYTAFCEGDDHWQSRRKLQKQVDVLEAEPGCVLVHSDYDSIVFPSMKRWPSCGQAGAAARKTTTPSWENLCTGAYPLVKTCTACTRTVIIQKLLQSDLFLYHSGHFPMLDTQLWTEVVRHGGVRYIDESLATYAIHAGSATHPRSVEQLVLFERRSSELTEYLLAKHAASQQTIARWRACRRASLLQLAARRGLRNLGNEAYRELCSAEGLSWGQRVKARLHLASARNPAVRLLSNCVRRTRRVLRNSPPGRGPIEGAEARPALLQIARRLLPWRREAA